MRKILVLSMITLDGVMQSPGAPEEDTEGGFEHGGWVAPFDDEVSGELMQRLLKPADLLLGRKTFQIWEDYWPEHSEYWPSVNAVTKYVFSNTITNSEWENTVFLNSVSAIRNLKNTPVEKQASKSTDIQVWGSSELIQLLLKQDLVDELWLIIYPLTLGKGKKLFVDGAIPAAFTLIESSSTPSGLIFAHFKRAGEVKTGTVGA
ncbi:dihydrofolate reductase family protein [Algoriphagus resistens]|uniref:dihydrofolate reductase family protein n=1 Tax=Algoriphagus resistens TaxID=1750590 RepID=UPI000716C0E6|nr:dihydrofolate reductase family protein [Algoriphagus resistens]